MRAPALLLCSLACASAAVDALLQALATPEGQVNATGRRAR